MKIFLTETQINKLKYNIILENDDEEIQSSELIKKIDDLLNTAETKPVPVSDEALELDKKDEGNLKLINGEGVKVYEFDIVKSNWDLFKKAMASIEKMARKFRVTPPTIDIKPERSKVIRPIINGEVRKFKIGYIPVTITFTQSLKLSEDYVILGVYDNISKGSVRFTEEVIPTEFLTPSGECDICKTNRYRGKIYIGKDLKTGEFKRFGSNCVKKTYGINPVKFFAALDLAKLLIQLVNDFSGDLGNDSEGGFGGGGSKGISPKMEVVDFDKAVTLVKIVVDEMGYIKKLWRDIDGGRWGNTQRVRDNQGKATSDVIEDILLRGERETKILPDVKFDNIKVDSGLVEEFKNYWNNFKIDESESTEYLKESSFNEFLKKIKSLVERGDVRIIDSGMLAFAMKYFLEKQSDKMKKPSEYVGVVGQKMLFDELKLVDARSYVSQFGPGFIWMFVDKEGNKIKKFGTLDDKLRVSNGDGKELYDDFRVGDTFSFISDVKKHEDYKGEKSTLIGRTSIVKKPKIKKISENQIIHLVNQVLIEIKKQKN